MTLKSIFLFLLFLVSFRGYAEAHHSVAFVNKARVLFYNEGIISDKKINQYLSTLNKRKEEISEIIYNYEKKLKGKSKKKIKKKIENEDLIIVLDHTISIINKLRHEVELSRQYGLIEAIFELNEAAKVEGDRLAVLSGLYKAKSIMKNVLNYWVVTEKSDLKSEAANIDKGMNEDLSLIDPKTDNKFWEKLNIKNVDIRDRYLGKSRLYENVDLEFPTTGVFKKIRKTQTKPKMDILSQVAKGEKKFKLKVGSEMHSEITSAALLAGLGYYTDVSKYVRDFTMTLPVGMSLVDYKKEWNSYYDSWDLDKYIKETGRAEDGSVYITFTEAIIENKPEELLRAGAWAFGAEENRDRREVRGLLLFNMWVANLDLKEAENNKLIMKPSSENGYDIYKYQHDLGFSFGRFSREKPAQFPWSLVKKYSKNSVTLSYWSFQDNHGFDEVTYADAKWMVRKISQLTREQIQDAVQIAGWPGPVSALLTEKLISRRNDLVNAFGISDEYPKLTSDNNITTDTESIVNGVLSSTVYEGYTQDFGNEIKSLLKPVGEKIESLILKAAREMANHFDTFTLNPEDFGIDKGLIAEIEVNVYRDVDKNPQIEGDDDNYIVLDRMILKFSLGGGLVVRGRVNYLKEYKLVYPVKTKRMGEYNNKFIVNALLPYHLKKGKLPNKYVMVIEDSLEVEAEALVDLGVSSVFKISAGTKKGILGRVVISNKRDEYNVYRDRVQYTENLAKLYAKVFIVKIPLWKGLENHGELNRTVHTIDLNNGDGTSKSTKVSALDALIIDNNFELIKKYGVKTDINSAYNVKKSKLGFLGLYKYKEKERLDIIKHTIYEPGSDSNVDKIKFRVQNQLDETEKWAILGNGETKIRDVRLVGKLNSDASIEKARIDVFIKIDDLNTKSSELKKYYLPLINKISGDEKFLNFTPHLHNKNNWWGNSFISVNLMYGEKAINKLINASADDLWNSLSQVVGVPVKTLKKKTRIRSNKFIKSNKRDLLLFEFNNLVNLLDKAKRIKLERDKYILVSRVIYRALYTKREAVDPRMLQAIHNIIGDDSFYMDAKIEVVEERENKYPTRTPLYNVKNPDLYDDYHFYAFDFDEPVDIWTIFQ